MLSAGLLVEQIELGFSRSTVADLRRAPIESKTKKVSALIALTF